MTIQLDFFGNRYDDDVPAFITCGPKFYTHRPSGKLLDKASVDAAMTAAGYTPTSKEIGAAPASYLATHLGIPVPAPSSSTGTTTATKTTKATAGKPGSFTGPVPADLTALKALGALGNTTKWAVGEYVTLGDGSKASWNGTAWVVGAAK